MNYKKNVKICNLKKVVVIIRYSSKILIDNKIKKFQILNKEQSLFYVKRWIKYNKINKDFLNSVNIKII